MRRREPLRPARDEMPARLRRYSPAEWVHLVDSSTPTTAFLERYEAQRGTRSTVERDWWLDRAIRARHVWRAERDAWCDEPRHGRFGRSPAPRWPEVRAEVTGVRVVRQPVPYWGRVFPMENLTCAREGCGLPVPHDEVFSAVLGPRSAREAAPRYCSTTCLHRSALGTTLRHSRCPVCGKSFERATGVPGRPARYCSESCRRDREHALDRAWKLLGKGTGVLPEAPRGSTVAAIEEHVAALAAVDTDLRALAAELRARQRRQPVDPLVADRLNDLRHDVGDRLAAAEKMACEIAAAAANREEHARSIAAASHRRAAASHRLTAAIAAAQSPQENPR